MDPGSRTCFAPRRTYASLVHAYSTLHCRITRLISLPPAVANGWMDTMPRSLKRWGLEKIKQEIKNKKLVRCTYRETTRKPGERAGGRAASKQAAVSWPSPTKTAEQWAGGANLCSGLPSCLALTCLVLPGGTWKDGDGGGDGDGRETDRQGLWLLGASAAAAKRRRKQREREGLI
ncbi:hypothetical protein LX36DRAFT_419269 [Colletotrichum falcatum]|nr:hypothetical protein LX36DRAFT_419269 [Colletotrichum falcatum]